MLIGKYKFAEIPKIFAHNALRDCKSERAGAYILGIESFMAELKTC